MAANRLEAGFQTTTTTRRRQATRPQQREPTNNNGNSPIARLADRPRAISQTRILVL